MASSVGSTLLAKNLTKLDRAAFIVLRAVGAQHTILAPKAFFKVTTATAGAMAFLPFCTIPAKQSKAKINRAAIADIGTGFTGTAFNTPALRDKIAGTAFGTVGTLFFRTIGTHISTFLIGAAVTDLCACTIGTLTALQAQLYTFLTLIALTAVGRSVDPILTVWAGMSGIDRKHRHRQHTNNHNQC